MEFDDSALSLSSSAKSLVKSCSSKTSRIFSYSIDRFLYSPVFRRALTSIASFSPLETDFATNSTCFPSRSSKKGKHLTKFDVLCPECRSNDANLKPQVRTNLEVATSRSMILSKAKRSHFSRLLSLFAAINSRMPVWRQCDYFPKNFLAAPRAKLIVLTKEFVPLIFSSRDPAWAQNPASYSRRATNSILSLPGAKNLTSMSCKSFLFNNDDDDDDVK